MVPVSVLIIPERILRIRWECEGGSAEQVMISSRPKLLDQLSPNPKGRYSYMVYIWAF